MDLRTGRWAWSPELFDVFATAPDQTTPSTRALMALKHPDDRSRSESLLATTMANGRAFRYQHRIVRPDGHQRDIGVEGGVIEADARPLAIVGTVDALSPWHVAPFPPAAGPAMASEGELVIALRARVPDACEEAVRRHTPAVLRQVRSVLASPSQIDDVVQHVFLALWLHPGRFDPSRSSLTGFLRLQARYRAIDLQRSENSRRRREQRTHVDLDLPTSTEDDVSTLLAGEDVRAALVTLPERERRPIELAFLGGLSYRAVAAELGEAEGTVKSRIRSGLLRLRPLLRS